MNTHEALEARLYDAVRHKSIKDRVDAVLSILKAEEPRGEGCHVCRCGGNGLCKCQCHWKTADEVLAKLDEQVKANEEAIRSDERRKIAESEDVPVTETCPRCFLSYTSFRKQAEEPRGDGLTEEQLVNIAGKANAKLHEIFRETDGHEREYCVHGYIEEVIKEALALTSPARTEGLKEALDLLRRVCYWHAQETIYPTPECIGEARRFVRRTNAALAAGESVLRQRMRLIKQNTELREALEALCDDWEKPNGNMAVNAARDLRAALAAHPPQQGERLTMPEAVQAAKDIRDRSEKRREDAARREAVETAEPQQGETPAVSKDSKDA